MTNTPRPGLTAARERAGLNQGAAATLAGIHRVTLNKYESGAAEPGVDVALRIARVLGASAEQVWEPAAPTAVDPDTAASFDRTLRNLKAVQKRAGASAAITERGHRATLEALLPQVNEARRRQYRRAIGLESNAPGTKAGRGGPEETNPGTTKEATAQLTDLERMEREAQMAEAQRAYLDGDMTAEEWTKVDRRLRAELGLEARG